jgi:hypothetical protein
MIGWRQEPWSDQSKVLSSIGLSALNAAKTGLWLAFGACFLSCIDGRYAVESHVCQGPIATFCQDAFTISPILA